MTGVPIYEPSETLFRKQLAEFLASAGLADSGVFSSMKLSPITTTQKNALGNTAGMLVFDTTLGKLCVNNGAAWQTVTST